MHVAYFIHIRVEHAKRCDLLSANVSVGGSNERNLPPPNAGWRRFKQITSARRAARMLISSSRCTLGGPNASEWSLARIPGFANCSIVFGKNEVGANFHTGK
jgi:hypothetical protein